MTRNERSILTVTLFGHALCHWSVLTFSGLLTTFQREFDLSPFWVTVLPISGYVLMGLGAVPAGMLTDRWQAKGVLAIYFLATGASALAVAVAWNVWVLAAALAGLGAAVSLYHPTGLALISHGFAQRGRVLGIHGVAGSIGLLGAPYGLWMASLGTWRLGYAIVAGAALPGAVLLALLPIRESHDSTAPTGTRPARESLTPEMIKVLVLLYAAMMLGGFNYRALMTALPHFVSTYGAQADPSQAAWGRALIVLMVGGFGQYFAGHYSDRANPVRVYVALAATSIPMAVLFGLSGGAGMFGIATGMGLMLFHFGTQPVENLLIARHTPSSLRSTSYGIKFALTFGVGAVGSLATGWIWERTGSMVGVFYLFAAVAGLVVCIILLLVKASAKQEAQSRPASREDAADLPVVREQA